jgi:hypothetical protein
MLEVIGVASGVLAAGSYVPYSLDILRSKVRPERASWLIWSVLAGIAFFSQLAKGATNSAWFTGLDGIGAALVFVLALKFGVGGFTKRDITALIVSAVGLLIWFLTSDSLYALLVIMIIDAVGTSLTIAKTLKDPTTETYSMWVIVCIASCLALAAVGEFNMVLLVYPAYILLANLSVIAAKFFGERKKVH